MTNFYEHLFWRTFANGWFCLLNNNNDIKSKRTANLTWKKSNHYPVSTNKLTEDLEITGYLIVADEKSLLMSDKIFADVKTKSQKFSGFGVL